MKPVLKKPVTEGQLALTDFNTSCKVTVVEREASMGTEHGSNTHTGPDQARRQDALLSEAALPCTQQPLSASVPAVSSD